MSNQAHEIKAARERAHLTQQEVADKVGVSLRTVGNWERGGSIPRSRMGALVEVLGLDDPEREIVAHLGRMVRAERARLGYTSVQKASDAADIGNYRTLGQFELGHTMPQPPNRAKIETLLMWRDGSLTEALSKDVDELTFEWFRDWERDEPVSAASDLTDEALLTELIKRLDSIRLKVVKADELEARLPDPKDGTPEFRTIDLDAPRNGTPAQNGPQISYELAAHTPRSGKKVDPRKATRK